MFIRILAAGLALITLYFTTGGEIMTQIEQLPSYIGQLIESVASEESAATPAPSDAAESATPTPVLSAEEELISLAKQLTPDEIDMLKRMIEVPEYDDLTLMQQLQRYSPHKYLKNLINKAVEYGFQTYTALVSKIGNGLPDAMPDPVPLTTEEKNLIISQFLNQEGAYTNEELLKKTIPKDDKETAVLGIFEYIGEVGDAKAGTAYDLNLAKCETMLLFTESVGERDYIVIGMTDVNKNRMVSIIENYFSEYTLMHTKYKISCMHSKNQQAQGTAFYDIEFKNKSDYLLYLNRYRNQVMITQFEYRPSDVKAELARPPKDYYQRDIDAHIESLEYHNSRATVAAGLLKAMWKEKKIKYNGDIYFDNSSGNNEVMSIAAPRPFRIENYEDVQAALQSPDVIPIAQITFRIYIPLD